MKAVKSLILLVSLLMHTFLFAQPGQKIAIGYGFEGTYLEIRTSEQSLFADSIPKPLNGRGIVATVLLPKVPYNRVQILRNGSVVATIPIYTKGLNRNAIVLVRVLQYSDCMEEFDVFIYEPRSKKKVDLDSGAKEKLDGQHFR